MVQFGSRYEPVAKMNIQDQDFKAKLSEVLLTETTSEISSRLRRKRTGNFLSCKNVCNTSPNRNSFGILHSTSFCSYSNLRAAKQQYYSNLRTDEQCFLNKVWLTDRTRTNTHKERLYPQL